MTEIAGTARFISDLHLRAERPDLVQRFASFLGDTAAANVDSLFILGDLFEYWIGDDDLADPFNADVCDLLRSTADMGTSLYFIAGNRDFLIGPRFAAAARMILLDDAVKVGAGGTATLLLHGDTVCTDDLPYQEFRHMVRREEWQQRFLARPLAERRAEVGDLRRRSTEAMQGKTAEIMDANVDAIRAALSTHGCRRLIHGHTHRPGHDTYDLPSGRAERYVLSDWDTGRGDALEIGPAGIRRIDLSA
ncbi:MAG: UDP-2,3-diacylglucosamine diphosphatase [Rhodocyclales bacterium]|nr:UDP-2,3-diacylglucosamine diphosphatase [Rhodocyclales bacterium]